MNMKKSLIALAVLAASGASFAQVTITGNVIIGFEADHFGGGTQSYAAATNTNTVTNALPTDQSGLGGDTVELYFNVSEDLGGGMKATAKLGLDTVARAGVVGGDTVLSLSGGFGTLTAAAVKGADYLSGGVAKVGGTGMDGKVFSARTSAESLTYSYPFGAFTVSGAYIEPANTLGLAAGTSGTPGTYSTTAFNGKGTQSEQQRAVRLSGNYKAGALVVDGGYATYDQQGTTVVANEVSDLRVAASYDLGVAQLGGGLNIRKRVGGTRTDYLVSAAVPVGALTLGADFASRQTADFTAVNSNGTITGYGLNVEYNLSKRTKAGVYYTNFKQAILDTENSSYTAVLLSHSF